MKTHFEVFHDTEGWMTACASNSQHTTALAEHVDCGRCRASRAFKASQQPRNEHEGKATK